MSELISSEQQILNEYREKNDLPKPVDFEEGRIDPKLSEKLMPMVSLPFDDKAVKENNGMGFKSKGVSASLQEFRLQEVFGKSHIRIEREIITNRFQESQEEEIDEVNNDEKERKKTKSKKGMYYYLVEVIIKIGNYTPYADKVSGKPDSSFVTYYEERGSGFAGGISEGIALKSAIANGKKDAFSNMGMLRYLHIENDTNKTDTFGENANVVLLEKPIFYDSGTIFMKGKAKDTDTEKEIMLVIYRENKFNKEAHKEMVELLDKNKDRLVKNKSLNIIYLYKDWHGEDQYIVNGIITNKNNN